MTSHHTSPAGRGERRNADDAGNGFTVDSQLRAVLDCLPFYVLLVDSDHVIHFANKCAREEFGVGSEQLVGQYCPEAVHGVDDYPGCPLTEAVEGSTTEKTHYSPEDGRWWWTTAYRTGMKTTDGLDVYFHMVRDVTEEVEEREVAADVERKFYNLFQSLEDAVFVMSADGTLEDINRAGLDLLQIADDARTRDFNLFRELGPSEEWDRFRNALQHDGRVADHEITFTVADGGDKTVSITASLVTDGSLDSGLIRGIMRDITRHKELEELSVTDALTALYNRRFFTGRLEGLVRRTLSGEPGDLSVLFLDIDDFKSYNDTYGHQDGDHLMRRVAESIRLALRDGDVAARYGGEEFAVILTCDAATACEVGERIRANVEATCSTKADKGIRRDVTVSVGVATLGPGIHTVERLVGLADSRMYEAKQDGKNRVRGPRRAGGS